MQKYPFLLVFLHGRREEQPLRKKYTNKKEKHYEYDR